MVTGPMMFGTNNDAGADQTVLGSNVSAAGGELATLTVLNTADGVDNQHDAILGLALAAPNLTEPVNGVKGVTNGENEHAAGVYGLNNNATSQFQNGVGVIGESLGSGTGAVGVWGKGPENGLAGLFTGNVRISNDLTVSGALSVLGAKSALAPYPDGSHRRLYSMESPESWFEDFGTGEVVGGRGLVRFDPEFAELTCSDNYHVFLTPRGDCGGLYVGATTSDGFEVHELRGGTSNVLFDYRVVARRKDVTGPRLECVRLPEPS